MWKKIKQWFRRKWYYYQMRRMNDEVTELYAAKFDELAQENERFREALIEVDLKLVELSLSSLSASATEACENMQLVIKKALNGD